MEGEEVCFFVVFIDLERHKSFAYIPTLDSKQILKFEMNLKLLIV